MFFTKVKQAPDKVGELEAQTKDQQELGSKFPGMSYEDGIVATLEWLYLDGPHPLQE